MLKEHIATKLEAQESARPNRQGRYKGIASSSRTLAGPNANPCSPARSLTLQPPAPPTSHVHSLLLLILLHLLHLLPLTLARPPPSSSPSSSPSCPHNRPQPIRIRHRAPPRQPQRPDSPGLHLSRPGPHEYPSDPILPRSDAGSRESFVRSPGSLDAAEGRVCGACAGCGGSE